jgi:hypothetical protein
MRGARKFVVGGEEIKMLGQDEERQDEERQDEER